MTDERFFATPSTPAAQPVRNLENNDVEGYALCSEHIFHEHVQKTQSLRDRHAAYLDGLPTDPKAAVAAANKLLRFGLREYPDGIEEALHLSWALSAMVQSCGTDEEGPQRSATIYVAERVALAMIRATQQLDRISDILGNPGRVERQ
ncbi:hypothetical protein [Phaeobacter sp. J2-8]|uniref:hypothetical protein n=1 Tax=Phaeobacter sp. J2-8 TaxID=2931394 RepID=UPI001FD336F2|nr:hypothetical protein [Phaeobacter sp. J2-8]MCJ7871495.1 hypothetical protein [Phaeobacter sp. J2-8]